MATKAKESALSKLNGIIYTLDNRRRRPTLELLEMVRQLATDAIAVLQEPDEVKRKIGFVLLAIQQSTEVKVRMINGKRITRVTINDQVIYNWALEEIHALAGTKI